MTRAPSMISDLVVQQERQSGFISSPAGELFFEQAGDTHASPLICIHGGPGFTGHYLEPLFELSGDLPVICYDQAGSGRSRSRSPERLSHTIEAFVEELEALRVARGSAKVHLLGHSFGGLIAGEYALRYPERVASIVFACVSIDIPRWIDDAQRLVSAMPLMQRMILKEGLRTASYSSPQFVSALSEYYAKHVYGFEQKPECILRAEASADARTYQIVWGANELAVTGYIRDYSMSPRLGELRVPTLFVCGRFDEATPEAHQYFSSLVPGSRCHIFEKSAHHPQLTETAEFIGVLREFLRLQTE